MEKFSPSDLEAEGQRGQFPESLLQLLGGRAAAHCILPLNMLTRRKPTQHNTLKGSPQKSHSEASLMDTHSHG